MRFRFWESDYLFSIWIFMISQGVQILQSHTVLEKKPESKSPSSMPYEHECRGSNYFICVFLALRLLSYLLISRCGATSIAKVQSDCYGRQVASQLIFNSFLKRPRFPHSDRKTDKSLHVMIIIYTQKRLKHCNLWGSKLSNSARK